MTRTREEQVSTITQQVPRAVNADRVIAERRRQQAVQLQRDHAQQQLYHTESQTGTEWSQPWWKCGGDVRICLCGTFCFCCMICSNAQALGKSGFIYNVLACITPCIPVFLLREEASKQYGIKTDVETDLALSWCCTECVNCQIAAEIKAQERKQHETEVKVIEKESQMH